MYASSCRSASACQLEALSGVAAAGRVCNSGGGQPNRSMAARESPGWTARRGGYGKTMMPAMTIAASTRARRRTQAMASARPASGARGRSPRRTRRGRGPASARTMARSAPVSRAGEQRDGPVLRLLRASIGRLKRSHHWSCLRGDLWGVSRLFPKISIVYNTLRGYGGGSDGTRTRGLWRDRPAL